MKDADRDIATGLRDDICSAFALLTRLPLPGHAPQGARSAWAWPVAGAVVGAGASLIAVAADVFALPAGVTAAAAMAVLAMLTGALHEDGLADTADGFFGGHTPDRRLAIMKDSHIGSFGTLALILVTLARWSALTALCAGGHGAVALITAGAASRVPMVALMAALPNARGDGLSHSVGRPDATRAVWAGSVAAALTLVLAPWSLVWLVASLVALTAGLGALATRRIGGQTGDVLGASQQLADAACLAILAATLIP